VGSAFKKSSDLTVYDKILFWGPPETGKTHAAMTWPGVAHVDTENRGAHFADRFDFLHAEVGSIKELGDVFKEIRSGSLSCETIVTDSYSAIYDKLVIEHSKPADSGKHVTDYPTVNKRISAVRDFAFSIPNMNVIFLAHAKMKYEMVGTSMRPKGIDFNGDATFRYAFDYVFQLQSNGDPRTNPATFIVEKSASPNLKRGDKIVGLDYTKFKSLTATDNFEVHVDAQADDGEPVGPDEIAAINDYAQKRSISNMRVVTITKAVGHTTQLKSLTKGSARKVYALLQREPHRGVA